MSSVWALDCQDVTLRGRAGVGVVNVQGAPLSLSTFATPSFSDFFRLGRAMRVVLFLGNGGGQAEGDAQKFALADQLVNFCAL